jgi:predicted dinucleotide-binding enzyme
LGRGDGDASDADAVLVAVPRTPISAALGKVTGLEGKVGVDATNSFPSRHGKFGSYAEDVKNFIRGPVANMHVGALLELASEQRVRSSNWCVADDDARRGRRAAHPGRRARPVERGPF